MTETRSLLAAPGECSALGGGSSEVGRGTASSIPPGSQGSLQPELLWSEFISGKPKLLWRGTRTPEPREETARDCSPEKLTASGIHSLSVALSIPEPLPCDTRKWKTLPCSGSQVSGHHTHLHISLDERHVHVCAFIPVSLKGSRL